MSELYLVRHAQAAFGGDDYDQLSALGNRQSRLLGEYFSERAVRLDHLIAGDMRRHRQTLDGICDGLGLPNRNSYRTHQGLNEYDFEKMVRCYCRLYPSDALVRAIRSDPLDKAAFYRLLRQVLAAWRENQLDENLETWSEFRQRVLEARSMLQDMAESARRVLVVSSGGAISLFIGSVLDLSPEKVFDLNMQIHNTSVSRLFFNRNKMSVASFNALPHLDRPDYADFVTYG